MSGGKRVVVLVHGWSVRSTETYGDLPERLRREARGGTAIDVRNIWLSKYVSFHDEVRLEDLSRAFEVALRRELGDVLGQQPVAVITHSTGGPLVRDWLQRFYVERRERPPISHLVMLAPANFGSPLAQLGQSRLARLKTWFEGVEPGRGVLEWLELGSEESLALNLAWLKSAPRLARQGVFSFVLTGTSIDHALYDFLNAYTGELDSDGVVRAAGANLNFRHITLRQVAPAFSRSRMLALEVAAEDRLDGVPFSIVPARSHSGETMGILRSIAAAGKDPTVDALLECLAVNTAAEYRTLFQAFRRRNAEVRADQRIEMRELPGPFDRTRIKDPCSQLIFRVRDHQGRAVNDFSLMLTADGDSPDRLPPGFFVDRQQNQRDPSVITYYLNTARMLGDSGVITPQGRQLRLPLPPAEGLGLCVEPFPQEGFVHYLPGRLPVSAELLETLVVPQQTTVVDIELHRVVHEGTFRLTRRHGRQDFTDAKPGKPLAD